MRLLLDENLPKKLKQGLEIYTTSNKGWIGISNGKLLGLLIENKFDAHTKQQFHLFSSDGCNDKIVLTFKAEK